MLGYRRRMTWEKDAWIDEDATGSPQRSKATATQRHLRQVAGERPTLAMFTCHRSRPGHRCRKRLGVPLAWGHVL